MICFMIKVLDYILFNTRQDLDLSDSLDGAWSHSCGVKMLMLSNLERVKIKKK